jgi:hypothetical protein
LATGLLLLAGVVVSLLLAGGSEAAVGQGWAPA